MKISILLRVPFLDKIPSLKTLIVDLARRGVDINIISVRDDIYPICDFNEYSNVKRTLVKQRKKIIELPTSVKLFMVTLRSILLSPSDYYIGGDNIGCHLLYILKKIISFKFLYFLLEYPEINNSEQLREIESANFVITHDHWHSDFISKYCSVKQTSMLFLPNSSYTEQYNEHDDYLSRKLNIPSKKYVILHSGGLGKWFCCKELARSAKKWDESYVLVFHTSHFVDNSPYFKDLKEEVRDSKKIYFSTNPVPNIELDKLVASAKIGIATYSLKYLGYRAENMGLAAGKIGNYLKCGIPVIATKVHSLSYLEDYHCGILVNNTDEINEAMARILERYDSYVEGAYKCYNDLWYPKSYLESIYETLTQNQ